MLDTETKKQIDNCRDILVGKLPDPKSQVEQITIALIYKFMDDMDKEAEEWNGKPTFFTGDFEKYAWHKIFDPRISSFDMLNLYSEAIQKMNQNPKIPQLFRDIFKNAYLPYRDPETLKSFLKEINTFHYSHSEKLGDAFEYLLSVLGSQGDAGQFRTPRHLIDFMAEIVAPQKGETILDPACGTAGFLVAAYKYILKTNMDKRPGDLLSPDDRKRFVENFNGYDISPDMVRLSLVNLYLHGFSEPHVYEYDTLTSEDHWGEGYDIVLANPPFMSPKGGIKPHKRFAIQAKRSEVLFVDYIAEHLNPQGRAAVIVPEGIIFQTQTAYKDLRKMLLDSYLWGVISLPAGVFQPYSGVKTSILLMDKRLVKRTENVIFLKLDNDGYGLGAQRREIELNDLPTAIQILNAYKSALFSGKQINDIAELFDDIAHQRTDNRTDNRRDKACLVSTTTTITATTIAHIITKSKIAEKGDYILSGERYRVNEEVRNEKYEFVELEEVCDFINGFAFESKLMKDKKEDNEYVPVIKIGNLLSNGKLDIENVQYYQYSERIEKCRIKCGDILIAMSGATVGKIAISANDNLFLNQRAGIVRRKSNAINEILLGYFLKHDKFYKYCQLTAGGAAIGNISPTQIFKYQIPLPPLTIQEQIVSEIENYQKIIDGAKQIVENWKPQIKINEEWEVRELGEVCDSFQYGSSKKSEDIGDVVCLRMGNIQNGEIDWSDLKYAPSDEELNKYLLKPKDVLFNRTNSPILVGKTGIYRGERKAVFAGYLIRLNYIKEKLLGDYLNYCLNTKEAKEFCLREKTDGINQSNINAQKIARFIIPVPPLSEQESIVKAIEEERAIVKSNKRLIEIFEGKIKAKIAEVWGE
jgi:type I restriction enzyme M protein